MEVVYLKIFIDLYNLPPLLGNLKRTNEILTSITGEKVVLDTSFKNLLFDRKLYSYFREKYEHYLNEKSNEKNEEHFPEVDRKYRKRRYRDAINLISRIIGKRKDNTINECLGGSIKKYKDKIFKIRFHSEEYNYFIACTEKLLTQYKKGKIYVILSIGSQTKNVIDYIIDYLKRKIHDLQYEQVEIVPKEEVIIFYRG